MRTQADLLDLEELAGPLEDPELDAHRLYAQANAFDLDSQRSRAIGIYQALSSNSTYPESIRRNALIRMNTPYTRPETILPSRSLTIAKCQ